MRTRADVQCLMFVGFSDSYRCITDGEYKDMLLCDFFSRFELVVSDNITYFLAETDDYEVKCRFFGKTVTIYLTKLTKI